MAIEVGTYRYVFVNRKTGHFNFEKPSTSVIQRLELNNKKPTTHWPTIEMKDKNRDLWKGPVPVSDLG